MGKQRNIQNSAHEFNHKLVEGSRKINLLKALKRKYSGKSIPEKKNIIKYNAKKKGSLPKQSKFTS